MRKHFQRELEQIKKMVLALGAVVEDRVHMADRAIADYDAQIAAKIIATDYEIDEMEVELEEECLKALALHQPVAADLRFLVAVIKINNDLERIGDEAVNIAQRVEILAQQKENTFRFDYASMMSKVIYMLKTSLDALVNMDLDLAYRVLTLDDEVDKLKVTAYDRIKAAMNTRQGRVGYYINLLLISRHLERAADHATNIAEEVVYMVEGDIVRHTKI
ncbi:MAG: phosphate signaling complex protein PhoU [Desulfobacterales bacterium]|jgi:phosphate transport system protein|nr:phosphate signaling complex protein PhoU [Desulfobacterales bacterium]